MVGPRELLVEFPPFENNHHIEGIDNWWMELQKRYQVVSSKAVTYHHAFNQTASELSRWKRLQEIEYATLHPSKEIDPQRHKARLTEDPLYATLWSDEKARSAQG